MGGAQVPGGGGPSLSLFFLNSTLGPSLGGLLLRPPKVLLALDEKGSWEQWPPRLTQLWAPYHPGILHIHVLSWDLLCLQCNHLAEIVGCRRQCVRITVLTPCVPQEVCAIA